jgi:hypothetical protein
MRRPEYECFYGGAAGGGKSDALVAEALRQIDISHYKAIIFRKTYPQARELVLKSKRLYPRISPGCKYNSQEHCWIFPSGARIYFGSMPNSDSYLDYQGLSFQFIGFDELTHFSEEEYRYLQTRNRADGAGVRVYIRATGNPGGVGHGWVKARFITDMPPNTPKEYESKIIDPNGKEISVKRKKIFIPSSVFDNPKLLNNDPNYLANLAMQPEALKKALLYGDWNTFSGQVFTEWRDDPTGYETRKRTHVIEPFPVPKNWRRYRSFDYGYSRPFAVQWWAVDNDGRAYLYRQLYGFNGTPNQGARWEPKRIAEEIRRIEDEAGERNVIGVADPAIWDESRGVDGTIITMFEREGVYFEKGKHDRLSGKMQVHRRLAFDNEGYPMMYVFRSCEQFIRTIPNLVYDLRNVEDIDTSLEDHDYDAMRYFFMMNPLAQTESSTPTAPPRWDPLS